MVGGRVLLLLILILFVSTGKSVIYSSHIELRLIPIGLGPTCFQPEQCVVGGRYVDGLLDIYCLLTATATTLAECLSPGTTCWRMFLLLLLAVACQSN